MDKETKAYRAHILAIPYPSQGHVNPMLQFCKRLVFKGSKATFAVTRFISKSFNPKSDTVCIDTISDGFDDYGFEQANNIGDYLTQMEIAGSKTLEDLIRTYRKSNHPIDCIVYDALLPWVLEVAKKYDIKGACFFTQACVANYIYYYAHHGLLSLPVSTPPPVELPGLPPLNLPDMPSFICVHGSYPAYFKLLQKQFSNVEKADFVLVNTFYKLEEKVSRTLLARTDVMLVNSSIIDYYY